MINKIAYIASFSHLSVSFGKPIALFAVIIIFIVPSILAKALRFMRSILILIF
jgi:hypothetical protein